MRARVTLNQSTFYYFINSSYGKLKDSSKTSLCSSFLGRRGLKTYKVRCNLLESDANHFLHWLPFLTVTRSMPQRVNWACRAETGFQSPNLHQARMGTSSSVLKPKTNEVINHSFVSFSFGTTMQSTTTLLRHCPSWKGVNYGQQNNPHPYPLPSSPLLFSTGGSKSSNSGTTLNGAISYPKSSGCLVNVAPLVKHLEESGKVILRGGDGEGKLYLKFF